MNISFLHSALSVYPSLPAYRILHRAPRSALRASRRASRTTYDNPGVDTPSSPRATRHASRITHHASRATLSAPRISFLALLLLALSFIGCSHPQTRLQSGEEAERAKKPEIKTIRDVITITNDNPVYVSGVGLVTGLAGTGGNPPPGGFRSLVEDQLRKKGVENIKDLLASPNTSIVLVSAVIPPGAHKDDLLDVEVTLPPQSKTTSLRGGSLQECLLYNYDSSHNLANMLQKANPDYQPRETMPNYSRKGHPLAKASGPLLTGFGAGDESARLRRGRIWNGGRCHIERPYYLALNPDCANKAVMRAAIAQKIALRVNETLQSPHLGSLGELAVAKNDKVVALKVPPQYKHNQRRYLRVVCLVPLQGTPGDHAAYRRRLTADLLDPKETVTAALRLEALGPDSTEALKSGLESKHALVRFCSAEALAYLGSPACAQELARAVEEQPRLRALGLIALASLDESICRLKLGELQSSSSAEVRYGAFWALHLLDKKDPGLQGELLHNAFWLHRVAPQAPPLVHLSRSRRAEVVLFGEEVSLVPPFSILTGEFTVTAGRDDTRCTISRLSAHRSVSRRQCSLRLEEVLRTLADMGGAYPDVDELLRQAEKCEALTCKLAVDALPRPLDPAEEKQLARDGADDPDFLESSEE